MTESELKALRQEESASRGIEFPSRLHVLVRADGSAAQIDGRPVDATDPALWPNLLPARLEAHGIQVAVENGVLPGVTAIEFREWSRDPMFIPPTTDVTVVCIGGNVGTAPPPGLLPLATLFRVGPVRRRIARKRVRQALRNLLALGPVVLVEPPVAGDGSLDLRRSLKGVRAEITSVAEEVNCPLVRLPPMGSHKRLDREAHELIADRVAAAIAAGLRSGQLIRRRPGSVVREGLPTVILRSDSMALGTGLGGLDPFRPELWPHVMASELESTGNATTVLNMSYSLHDVQLELRAYERDQIIRRTLDSAHLVLLHIGAANWYPRGRPEWMSTLMAAIRPPWLQKKVEDAYRVIRPMVTRLSRGGFRKGDPKAMRAEFDRLVRGLRDGTKHLALLLPFPGGTPRSPFWTRNMDEFRDVVETVGRKHGVEVIDAGGPLRDLPWETLTYDGVHLNPAAHDLVGRQMARTVVERGLLV